MATNRKNEQYLMPFACMLAALQDGNFERILKKGKKSK